MATAQPNAAPQGGNTLTPEQLKQMQLFAKQALGVLLDDQHAHMLVAKAKQGDPAQATAEVVTPLLKNIYEAASGAGAKVDMVVVLAAGMQVVAMVGKMLEAAGVLEEKDIPNFCAQVTKIATEQHNASVQGGGAPAAADGMPSAPGPGPGPTGMVG